MSDRELQWLVEFNQWLEHAGNDDIVRTLLESLTGREWLAFGAHYARPRRIEITEILIERAHALLSRSPRHAEPIARLAIQFSQLIVLPTETDQSAFVEDSMYLEADARREHAHALLTIGDYNAARRSAEEATFLYGLAVDRPGDGSLASLLFNKTAAIGDEERARLERIAVLALIMGQVLHGQGETEDGLLLIEQASNVLLGWLDNKQRYVQGRTIYAMILAAVKRYAEAVMTLEETAHLARELKDNETLAHIVNNIGYCYYYKGNIAQAKKCFESALVLFEELGLTADALRPRNYLAAILINEGSYHRAVSALFISRASYLDAGLPNEAAEVMLKIVRALILADRADSINWQEIHRTFSDAGLRPEAMNALTHLRDIAEERTLRLGDVDTAEDILSRLHSEAVSATDEAG